MAWKLDDKGDIILNYGIQETKNLKDEVMQRLYLKLSLHNGEWYLHENNGIFWLNEYNKIGQVGKRIKEFNIKEQIKDIIINDVGVASINDFDVIFDNTKGGLTINANLTLANGDKISLT